MVGTIIVFTLLMVILMIFLNGLYVGAEFSTVGSRRTRISQEAANGDRSALRLLAVLEDPKKLDDYVATCQLGITVSSLALGAFGERYVASNLGPEGGLNLIESAALASAIVLAVFTLLQVVFGELFPKSLAVQFPEGVAKWAIWPILFSQFLFRPLIFIFNGSGRALLRLMGKADKSGHHHLYSSDEIEILVGESHEGGLLEDEERLMLRNAFRLNDLTARQVMVHRTKLVTASVDVGANALLDLALEEGYTRIPVYSDSIDSIIGFVHVKDAFRISAEGKNDLHDIVRDVIHIPESMPVTDVWTKLNRTRQYMAIVFDEYGGTEGMVTQEDLIEEIFGELQDEFDSEPALIRYVEAEDRIYLRGDLLVSDVNEFLNLKCPQDSADTIGGLVFNELRKRPEVGDETTIADVTFRVEQSEDLSIDSLSLSNRPEIDIENLGDWEVRSE